MPLSFATMLGGTLSLIGSSTNIVAAGVANKQALLDVAKGGAPFSMGMFDILPDGFDIHNIELKPGTPYPYNPHPTTLTLQP